MAEINIFINEAKSCEHDHGRKRHHAQRLIFEFCVSGVKFKGEHSMVTLNPGQSVSFKIGPVTSQPDPQQPGRIPSGNGDAFGSLGPIFRRFHFFGRGGQFRPHGRKRNDQCRGDE